MRQRIVYGVYLRSVRLSPVILKSKSRSTTFLAMRTTEIISKQLIAYSCCVSNFEF